MEKCRVLETGRSVVTMKYNASSHKGIDITDIDEKGKHLLCNIVAHSDGVVVAVRKDCKGFESGGSYGNYVKIRHNDTFATLYAHMKYGTVKVKVGDEVKAGQVIGYMGNTGTSYGGHLHFEVHKNGNKVDPSEYLFSELLVPEWPKKYTVKKGDTLEGISNDIYGYWDKEHYIQIAEANGIKIPELVKSGQVLTIPEYNGGVIRAAEFPMYRSASIAGTYKTTDDLYLRDGSGTTKKKLAMMPKGAVVECKGTYNIVGEVKWFFVYATVRGQKYEAFCSSEYLERA